MAATPFASKLTSINIEDEMRQSYLDYAMSVIVGRALPDVRDGLKPVHRRALYAMQRMGNHWNRAHMKSARVVGEITGKYHPHGDSAVYDAVVRMARHFSMRDPLVDGQGNFGSIDGDAAAAMRYTEVRMARIAHELLSDIDRDTIDFAPNYDNSEQEPSVLPAGFPNLLVNGSSGIAVGMATRIPPHNLREVINATVALLEQPDLTVEELLRHVRGPDFPTRGIINGASGIREAYRSGRGSILLRARAEFEEAKGSNGARIVISELPFEVNKTRLLQKIAELKREKRLTGIRGEPRDESDKDGIRVVIELTRGEIPDVVLNNLYNLTQLETSYGINMVALENGRPRLMTLKEILSAFIQHRRKVVFRRSVYELRKDRERAHIVEGLLVAIAAVDAMVELIKAAPNPAQARTGLLGRTWPGEVVRDLLRGVDQESLRLEDRSTDKGLSERGYQLSREQAQAILELRLQRLTGMEQDKLVEEYRTLVESIQQLLKILDHPQRLTEVVRQEMEEIRDRFGSERQTEIIQHGEELEIEDLIAEETLVVTLSRRGYVKAQPVSVYCAQRRGGRGKAATGVKEEDYIDALCVAHSHDTLLCFSSLGKVYWLRRVFKLPHGNRTAHGRPIVNLLPLADEERIQALLPLSKLHQEDRWALFATHGGLVKKTPLSAYARPLRSGIRAIALAPDSQLVNVALVGPEDEVMLFSEAGKGLRFRADEVRSTGRVSRGVWGLRTNRRVIAMLFPEPQATVLTVTERGYGKRTPADQFPLRHRGGQGVIAIDTGKRNGKLVGAVMVHEKDDIFLINRKGRLIRTAVREIPVIGRGTKGVRLMNLGQNERLVSVVRIPYLEEPPGNGAPENGAPENSVQEDAPATAISPPEEPHGDTR